MVKKAVLKFRTAFGFLICQTFTFVPVNLISEHDILQ